MRARLADASRATLTAAPGVAGLALVSFGAWSAYRPAGYVVAGALVLADVVASRVASRPQEPPQ